MQPMLRTLVALNYGNVGGWQREISAFGTDTEAPYSPGGGDETAVNAGDGVGFVAVATVAKAIDAELAVAVIHCLGRRSRVRAVSLQHDLTAINSCGRLSA